MRQHPYPALIDVYSRDGKEKGQSRSASAYRCQQEGCLGLRLHVQWPDGKVTRPCTKGMINRPDGAMQIG